MCLNACVRESDGGSLSPNVPLRINWYNLYYILLQKKKVSVLQRNASLGKKKNLLHHIALRAPRRLNLPASNVIYVFFSGAVFIGYKKSSLANFIFIAHICFSGKTSDYSSQKGSEIIQFIRGINRDHRGDSRSKMKSIEVRTNGQIDIVKKLDLVLFIKKFRHVFTKSCAAAAQSRPALEESVVCSSRPSGGTNTQIHMGFCADLLRDYFGGFIFNPVYQPDSSSDSRSDLHQRVFIFCSVDC